MARFSEISPVGDNGESLCPGVAVQRRDPGPSLGRELQPSSVIRPAEGAVRPPGRHSRMRPGCPEMRDPAHGQSGLRFSDRTGESSRSGRYRPVPIRDRVRRLPEVAAGSHRDETPAAFSETSRRRLQFSSGVVSRPGARSPRAPLASRIVHIPRLRRIPQPDNGKQFVGGWVELDDLRPSRREQNPRRCVCPR